MSHRTPYKTYTPPPRRNTKAEYRYSVMDANIIPASDTDYVRRVKDTFSTRSVVQPTETVWDLIISDEEVERARLALVKKAKASKSEVVIYPYVSRLANFISLAYGEHTGRNDLLVFASPHTTITLGDYLGARSKADHISFVATRATMTAALDIPLNKAVKFDEPFQRITSIGDGKPGAHSKGQLKSYLCALKQYRPDLATVHGFQTEKNKLYLASLNACGMTCLDDLDIGDIDAWIAHVILAYDSCDKRDLSLTVCAEQLEFVRWDATVAGHRISTAPFYAGAAPGRVTWAAFQVDAAPPQPGGDPATQAHHAAFLEKPPIGFLKISWQDSDGRFREGELLSQAHKDGWVPGLVRHRSYERDEVRHAVIQHVDVDRRPEAPDWHPMRRVKEVLHLASIGQPLSQCESLEHFLKVIYDGLEVHLHLWERGILHRDISWYNVLCNPVHDPATDRDKTTLERPCIDKILGKRNAVPCVLLADLDHAARWEQLWTPKYTGRRERTGTPMFVSVELSSARELFGNWPAVYSLVPLLHLFEEVEQHPYFKRAFPNDKGDFLRNFREVLVREHRRASSFDPPKPQPRISHRPRHDAEAFYWVCLYGLARAHPTSHVDAQDDPGEHWDPFSDDDNANDLERMAEFCVLMLAHRPGNEHGRSPYLTSRAQRQEQVLHSKIKAVAPLLENIATYLSIPWYLYEEQEPEDEQPVEDEKPVENEQPVVSLDHAHHALRRLLLLKIIALDEREGAAHEHNFAFDKSKPRQLPSNVLHDRHSMPSHGSLGGSGTTSYPGSAQSTHFSVVGGACDSDASISTRLSRKRKAPDGRDDTTQLPIADAGSRASEDKSGERSTIDVVDGQAQGGAQVDKVDVDQRGEQDDEDQLDESADEDDGDNPKKDPDYRYQSSKRAKTHNLKEADNGVWAYMKFFWNDSHLWFGR